MTKFAAKIKIVTDEKEHFFPYITACSSADALCHVLIQTMRLLRITMMQQLRHFPLEL